MTEQRHIPVRRTARYCVRGAEGGTVRELWVACHGYAQLARYFIRAFDPLDDGTRLIVAPEALNRFYHGRSAGESAQNARVAATWMTREDREHEIADYVAYLDALVDHLMAGLPEAVTVVGLGFSQGAATVSRWAALGRTRLRHVVLWGAGVAHDLELGPAAFRGAGIILVAGAADPHLDAAATARERSRLSAAGVSHDLVEYDGGHAIDAAGLAALVARLSS